MDSESITITDSLTIIGRMSFSTSHAQCAATLVKMATDRQNEIKASGTGLGKSHHDLEALVTSSIIMCASFMEVTANEFFSDCSDPKWNSDLKALPQERVKIAGDLWEAQIPRTAKYSTLEKFDVALRIFGKPILDKARNPRQDAYLVSVLRNALIHAEPVTSTLFTDEDNVTITVQEMEKKLNGKFELNPFEFSTRPFFPDKILSAGCAEWAFKSSVALSDHFFEIIGIKPHYDHIRSQFPT